jgi:protein-S-isoprenylcysteine O-methyltransferase Ste14
MEKAMQIYRHKQVGRLVLYALGLSALMSAILLAMVPSGPGTTVVGVVLIILLVCLFLFGSLTVEITSERLVVWFGPGLIRKEFRTEEIHDAQIVRNPWYYGWGIRLTPHGWLYNVSGFDAVELQFKDTRRFRIGTDEPQQLLAAIQQVLRHAN